MRPQPPPPHRPPYGPPSPVMPGGSVYGRPRRRDWLLTGSVIFLVVAVLVGGALFWQGRGGSPVAAPATAPASAAPAGPASSAAPATPSAAPSESPTPSPTPPPPDQVPAAGAFQIRNVGSGLCLQLADPNGQEAAVMVQQPCANTPTQRWTSAATGGDTRAFLNAQSNRCLDLSMDQGGGNDGAPIWQWACTGAANQLWRVVRNGQGSAALQSAQSSKCIAIAGAAKDPGTPVVQWVCHGGADEQWTFVPLG